MNGFAQWPWGRILIVGYVLTIPVRLLAAASTDLPISATLIILSDVVFVLLAMFYIAAAVARWAKRRRVV